MDGPRGYHTKQSQSERGRQIPYDFIYMYNLKYDTNTPICETDLWTQRRDLWLPSGAWGRGGLGVWD